MTLVPPAGIEPATHGLGNHCSFPLSYEGGLKRSWQTIPSMISTSDEV